MKKSEKLILDSVAFISGFPIEGECFTINEVINELKNMYTRTRAEIALSQGKLRILEPSRKEIEKVKRIAAKTGDLLNLSKTDIKLIALAHELNGTLITDDYDIQNVATVMKIKYRGIYERGIKEVFEWKIYVRDAEKYFLSIIKENATCAGRSLKKLQRGVRNEKHR